MEWSWNKQEREWRRKLLSYARGNVLEVGVGTGINFDYYPLGVTVTATDPGRKALEQARQSAEKNAVRASFILSTVESLELPAQQFDTVVSMFSLNAYDNPLEVLEKFKRYCKPGGLILLMEFGLSRYGMVKWLQQKWDPMQYRQTGSHINRDLVSMVTVTGMQLKRVEMKFAGMVYLVWATVQPVTGS
jgi:ubiquinone/menaquinone biosynthesis C-methylase UbiE